MLLTSLFGRMADRVVAGAANDSVDKPALADALREANNARLGGPPPKPGFFSVKSLGRLVKALPVIANVLAVADGIVKLSDCKKNFCD